MRWDNTVSQKVVSLTVLLSIMYQW